jgi:uncharacterized protein (DUF1501 family)
MKGRPAFIARRQFILGSGALFAWAGVPKIAGAAGRDPRLLVVILRGALDGLAAVAPVGDPQWAGLRGEEGLKLDGKPAALPLDSFFALNPAMPNLHRLFKKSQALIVHACASPYRERSHFDGQDVLESGVTKPGTIDTGWLNRAVAGIPARDRANPGRAFAVGPVAPLIARGPAPVLMWAPPQALPTSEDTTARLLDLYRHTDPELAKLLEVRLEVAKMGGRGSDNSGTAQRGRLAKGREYFVESTGTAARFLTKADGPRVGALGLYGWDTHAKEEALTGRLALQLSWLDEAIAAIEKESGAAWNEMVVVVVTEFGRTVLINGTGGTDHGTASVAFVIGGAVKGGRVIADWPGLRQADLYDGRDLKPTTDLRALLKGVLKEQLALDDRVLATKIFPGSEDVRPMSGLVG